jgi:hypothetical protein
VSNVFFRIKNSNARNEEEVHNILRRVGFVLTMGPIYSETKIIPGEKSSQSDKNYTSHTQIYESSHGYRFKVGSGNDWRLDVVDPDKGIFLISYRYGEKERMQTICHGICELLDLDYIYNLDFENLVSETFDSKLSLDENFDISRIKIKNAMKKLQFSEEELENKQNVMLIISEITLK